MDLMGPVLDRLTAAFRTRPQEQPGLFEQLREARTRVIEAVDFAFRHDDGQNSSDYKNAEIILLGVSRTMKTPLCLYLANRGWFAANVPVVQGVALPATLNGVEPRRVFGLTMRPARLLELRTARAQYLHMSAGGFFSAMPVADGDVGIILVSDRSTDEFLTTGNSRNASSCRLRRRRAR